VVRTITYTQPTRDLKQQLLGDARAAATEDSARLLRAFVDLLDQTLVLNPEKRITPEDALRHPFLTDATPAPAT
jgi:serine/threonine-protein kinase PRP4